MVEMRDGWNLIRDFMERLASDGRRGAIYRGQARKEWDIIPSGFRDSAVGITNDIRLNDWKWRSARFASPLPQDQVEWLIMAQHYGLATPLLDWTTSPLIALYFACEGKGQAEYDGCVWISALDHFEIAHHTLFINPFEERRAKPFAINGVGRSVRSTAQDSILTLHTTYDTMNFMHRRLFTVPAKLKLPVLAQLTKLGITGDRLLYDLGHLVTAMKAEYNFR
jgi:hypothetical protein